MDELSAQVASALARVERSIVEFIAEQSKIQHSIAQLRNEVVDAFVSHEIWPRRSSNAKRISLQEKADVRHHSKLYPKIDSSGNAMHQIGNEALEPSAHIDRTSSLQADGEELGMDTQNLATYLHKAHQTHTRMFDDNDDLAVEMPQSYESSLDPDWPTALRVRPCWKSLQSGAETPFSFSSQSSLPSMMRVMSISPEQVQHKKETKESARLFFPGSLKRSLLDLIAMAFLIWDLVFTPLQIAWNLSIEGWLLIVSVCISSFWTMDIFFSSCTAYYRLTGDLETRPLEVLLHYLRGYFLIDAFVVVVDWVSLLLASFTGAVRLTRIAKTTRLVRLMRVARLTRLTGLVDFLNSYGIKQQVAESVKIILLTAFLTHAISCLWFMVGNLHSSDTGYHWVGATWAESSPTFLNTSISFQYCSALQWTLSTMISGTASILALNSTEQVTSCCVILTGLLYQAFIVSNLSAIAVEASQQHSNLATTLSSLNKFCKAHNVSKQIALIARSQARAAAIRKANAGLAVKDVDGLQKIAAKVRTVLLSEAFEPHLSCHELFYLWSQAEKASYIKLINGAMDFKYVYAGMDVFVASEPATSSYLLSRGRAIYVQDPNVSKVLEKTEIHVILDKWLAEAALWTEWLHVGTLEAASDDCEVCRLSFEGFFSAVQSSSKIKEVAGAYAKEYQQRLAKAVPPSIPWPSDVATLGVEFMQILPALEEPVRMAFGFLALNAAIKMGLTQDAQVDFLSDEIKEGESNVVLVKRATQPSLQRLVSVITISVRRADDSILVQLGKFDHERFAPKCKLPGAKLTDRESMATTAERLVETLKQHIGDIVFEDCEIVEEFATSHKTQVPTYYIITKISYGKGEVSLASKLSGEASRASKGTPVRYSLRLHRAGIYESALEGRLRRENDLITVAYDNGDRYLCMWVNEAEFQFLKSKDGVILLQSLSDEGILRRQDAPDMNHTSDVEQIRTFPPPVPNFEAPCMRKSDYYL